MAFELIVVDPERRTKLTQDGFEWKRHNTQVLGTIGTLNTRIIALKKEALGRGTEAPNGLWDRALAMQNAGARLLEALIDSDESLVRTVPVSKPKES